MPVDKASRLAAQQVAYMLAALLDQYSALVGGQPGPDGGLRLWLDASPVCCQWVDIHAEVVLHAGGH